MILIQGKTYDKLKFLALTVLPALGTLYFALAGIWGLPSADEVVGTIVAVDTFLGVVLQLSSNAYARSDARFTGSVDVLNEEDGVQNFSLNIPANAAAIVGKKEIVLKVNHEDQASGKSGNRGR